MLPLDRTCETSGAQAGFSLLEALAALAMAALVAGGVAAVHSAHADASRRALETERELSVAESAMQALLSGAAPLRQGSMAVPHLEGAPVVAVRVTVDNDDGKRSLVRITVEYSATALESSMLLY